MPAEAPALSAEEVIAGYRLILGRPPESEEVVTQHRHAHASLEAFGEALARSVEFTARGFFPGLPPPREVGRQEVETTADAEGLARLMADLAERWEGLGETAPHWSVLGDARFAPERITASRAEFYASGQEEMRLIEAALARAGRALAEFRHGVEHGCGVGRVAVHLAPRLARYTGCDISVPHLRLAIEALAEVGLRRTELRRVTETELLPATAFDFWFCGRVLQHNPPPLVMATLEAAFAGLLPGGVAMFQLPVWLEGYRFVLADYRPGAEAHAVPQEAVLALADRHGCVLRDLREDNAALARPGQAVVNVMTFQKRG